MKQNNELTQLRKEINDIDQEMASLFEKRMKLSSSIATVKEKTNLAIDDSSREQEVINTFISKLSGLYEKEANIFIQTLISLSKIVQRKQLMDEEITIYIPPSIPINHAHPQVVYQGRPGAWQEVGAIQLFPQANYSYCEYFEDVFIQVADKKSDYGIVPIENSQTGAIGEVYDLLRKYGCFIVSETWVNIDHCLVASKETTLDTIREVISHPEGLKQCSRYLKQKNWDLTISRNTAIAAKEVSDKNNPRFAAISSKRAAELCGLSILKENISNDLKNKTRFIAIAKNPIYDEKSQTISVSFSTAHISGALCRALMPFMVKNINLKRVESRPVRNGNFRFFVDLEANPKEENTIDALSQSSAFCDYFEILGIY